MTVHTPKINDVITNLNEKCIPPQIIEATSPSAGLKQKEIQPQSNKTTDKPQIIEATLPGASLTQKEIQSQSNKTTDKPRVQEAASFRV